MKTSPFTAVLIVGLRRSGTTIFWETFRKNPEVVCFDEPFHPWLWEGVRENRKGTWPELATVWNSFDAAGPKEAGPITSLDELKPTLTVNQQEYFKYLINQAPRVVIDEVRVWRKLVPLLENQSKVFVIHLVRDPRAWVTAHLLPSGAMSWRRSLINLYKKISFFTRRGVFNNWRYEEIIIRSIKDRDELWHKLPQPPEKIMLEPAYKKLLCFWWSVVQMTERTLNEAAPDRHITLTLEEFAEEPRHTMQRVYEAVGWVFPSMSWDHIKPVRSGWQVDSKKWNQAFEWAGVPRAFKDCSVFRGSLIKEQCALTVMSDPIGG